MYDLYRPECPMGFARCFHSVIGINRLDSRRPRVDQQNVFALIAYCKKRKGHEISGGYTKTSINKQNNARTSTVNLRIGKNSPNFSHIYCTFLYYARSCLPRASAGAARANSGGPTTCCWRAIWTIQVHTSTAPRRARIHRVWQNCARMRVDSSCSPYL